MNLLAEIKRRFETALSTLVDDPTHLLGMIRPAQDARFGDYQANCAMPLGKKIGKPPRDVAGEIIKQLKIDDLCDAPEIAGPGFINLRLRDDQLVTALAEARTDERLSVAKVAEPRTVVVDYSAPNVAKPMHVGHIRSTVIGDAISRTLRFLGHNVITDNHLGDWGTQFGMIIYGYRHFLDAAAYQKSPVVELGRIYRLVRQIMDYQASKQKLPTMQEKLVTLEEAVAHAKTQEPTGDKAADKKANKARKKLESQLNGLRTEVKNVTAKLADAKADPVMSKLLEEHADIGNSALQETAKLHEGDAENLKLWNDFLKNCRGDIQKIYDRLGVSFDHELGESFYHDRLGTVVSDFQEKGLAKESDGAICVFMEQFDAPMIIRKRDGAFLYATTDLATIQYRMETWNPDAILYVVDFRQGEHFDKLFGASRLWGYGDVEFSHVSFGTVLGEDGKPFKTRSGDTVGLEGLLDEAVSRALKVVSDNDDAKRNGADLSAEDRQQIANVVGHAAIKYADLSQNRTTDYVFSYDKMVAMQGNTATYLQYSYARVQNIFSRGEVDIESLRGSAAKITLAHEKERALGLELLRFAEALDEVVVDYRPNLLTNYLFDLAKRFSEFYDACPVLKVESEDTKQSRLLLCDLTARTMRQGLALLGIDVVQKM